MTGGERLGQVRSARQAGAVPTDCAELVLARARPILPGVGGPLADTARAARRVSEPRTAPAWGSPTLPC
ncbi:hypothetical protein [Streptomyces sp. NPDC005408]|uniref:hypothetical protein n=1 Tax=Streptomyces sp. NPDC005408 TaxID=3155341 RepID=UPI0033B81107